MIQLRSKESWPDDEPGEKASAKDLSVTRRSFCLSAHDRNPVIYIISIVNPGNMQYTGLTLWDDLKEDGLIRPSSYLEGSIHYYINGVLQTSPTVDPGPPLMLSGITIPAGGNAVMVYGAECIFG